MVLSCRVHIYTVCTFMYVYRICSIIPPPRINTLPPLRGLSYCAEFLSRLGGKLGALVQTLIKRPPPLFFAQLRCKKRGRIIEQVRYVHV